MEWGCLWDWLLDEYDAIALAYFVTHTPYGSSDDHRSRSDLR